ncbi:MAG: acetate--CoA ligase family protein [Desulfobacterales bacterium]|nr:acetate--CoA ligase family protein [Desulfobacterales bacterium]
MTERGAGECSQQGVLRRFFEPESVAIIGSFREGLFGGYVIVKSLLNAGYKGRIFPVNPAYEEVFDLKVYPSVREVPERVDLAFIMINARSVAGVMEECADRGTRAIVVVADGFAERNEEGVRLQKELVQAARALGVRLIGPNTAGIANTRNGFNPCPYDAGYYRIRQGSIAICAQTGLVNPQAIPYHDMRFGVSKICDLGNKCDLDECDILEYLAEDAHTKVISMYLESILDGRRFLKVARRASSKKPLLVLKSGRTMEGAKASVSHTGSMAVNDRVFEGICAQAGILRIERFDELFEMPKIFASQPLPQGNRLGIVTFTGGMAVLAIDEAAKYGLTVTSLRPETAGMLDDIFQGFGKVPVDIGPVMAAVKEAFDLYPKILDAVMADDHVDALLNILWANPTGNMTERAIEAYEGLKGRCRKPLVTWIYGPDARICAHLTERVEEMGFPVFSTAERAIKALGLAYRYVKIRDKAQGAAPKENPNHEDTKRRKHENKNADLSMGK